MFAQTWIESLNLIFGTSTTTTAIIIALLLLLSIDIVAISAMRKNEYLIDVIIVIDFLSSLGLTFIEWLPSLVGVVIAFIFALLGTWIITRGA